MSNSPLQINGKPTLVIFSMFLTDFNLRETF